MRNPFQKPESVARYLKIGVTGAPGVGKTIFGLDAKNHGGAPVYVLSTESGDVHYIDDPRWGGFSRIATTSLEEIEEGISYMEHTPGGTLVVDTLTGIYESFIDAVAKDDGTMSQGEWGILKRRWKPLMLRLDNLPCNVVWVIHENPVNEYNAATKTTRFVGMKLDVEKTFERNPDTMIRLYEEGAAPNQKRFAKILKDRTKVFRAGDVIAEPHIGMWEPGKLAGTNVARQPLPSEVHAANALTVTGKPATGETTTTAAGSLPFDPSTTATAELYESLLTACITGFNAEEHKQNWILKHKPEIETLPEDWKVRLRKAVKAAPIHSSETTKEAN